MNDFIKVLLGTLAEKAEVILKVLLLFLVGGVFEYWEGVALDAFMLGVPVFLPLPL